MSAERKDEFQPWATCFLTDILLSYLEDRFRGKVTIDYATLFRGAEGFEVPQDPRAFLRNVNNWVPLSVLRELLFLSERVSGQSDIAYLAARSYFEEGQSEILSLFEIIFRVLNDVRSTVICAHQIASVQTNYLKLQSFESPRPEPGLYMLARFSESVRPAVGSMHLVRGMAEGFPRLYSFIESLQCSEEISQLRIEDAVREFPGYRTTIRGDRLLILQGDSEQPIVEARKTSLRSELVSPSPDFQVETADAVVVPMRSGAIRVLTNQIETDPQAHSHAQFGYQIVRPGP